MNENNPFNWLIALMVLGALVVLGGMFWLIAWFVVVIEGIRAGANS